MKRNGNIIRLPVKPAKKKAGNSSKLYVNEIQQIFLYCTIEIISK